MSGLSRRRLLQGSAAVAGGAVLGAGPFENFVAHAARPQRGGGRPPDYGPLGPVADLRDGVVRLELPAGFSYRSFGVAGTPLVEGGTTPTPARSDGMAAFFGPRGTYILVRNQEINGPVPAIGDPALAYDSMTGGGTTTTWVRRDGTVADANISLNGTQMNCAGGRTPWRTWITCEETVNGPDVGPDFTGAPNTALTQKHGYVFEVPAGGQSNRVPIRSAGRFAHEAAAVDPIRGAVYLTEDNFGFPSGFYRYLPPKHPLWVARLRDGGRLQMLRVVDQPNADLSLGQEPGARYRGRLGRHRRPRSDVRAGHDQQPGHRRRRRPGPGAGRGVVQPPRGRVLRQRHRVLRVDAGRRRGHRAGRPPSGAGRLRHRPRAGLGLRHLARAPAPGVRVALVGDARPARQRGGLAVGCAASCARTTSRRTSCAASPPTASCSTSPATRSPGRRATSSPARRSGPTSTRCS